MQKAYIFSFALLLVVKSVYAQGFQEVSQEVGIEHIFDMGDVIYGGGVAVLDFDNDGWEDIYITGGMLSDALYKNNRNGSFTNVFKGSGLELTDDYLTQGAIAGDIDNDGDKDLFVTVRAPVTDLTIYAHNLLFRNNGDGTFTDITKEWKLDQEVNFSTAAAFGDLNLDGKLDLFVGNYISDPFHDVFFPSGQNSILLHGEKDFLYLNTSSSFENVSDQFEINILGCALGASFTDYDDDYDLDIYVANDFGNTGQPPNALYQNQYPEQKFVEKGYHSGSDIAMNAMGIAIGDYNNDGHLDYFVTNMGPDYLLKNNGDGTFTESSVPAEVVSIAVPYGDRSYLAVSWGTMFFDYDHDGYQDLFVANGDLSPPALPNTNVMYRNNGNSSFTDVTAELGLADPHLGRGAAVFDYDKDGDLDLMVVNQKYPPETGIEGETPHFCLFENTNQKKGDWLKVKLTGTEANRDGYGARVIVHTSDSRFIREVDGGSSHMSHNSTISHFGLGNVGTIPLIEVYWPGGKRQIVENVQPNRLIEITENEFDTPILTSTEPQVDLEDYIAIHPNPARDFLHINVKNTKPGILYYDIIDVLGQTMDSGVQNLAFNNTKEFTLPLKSNLNTGTYIIRFSGVVIEKKIFTISR